MTLENILSKYNFQYKITEDYLEVWRNGYLTKFKKPIDMNYISIYLDLFAVYSPHSTKELKEMFPFYFVPPKKGDSIAVKKIGEYVDLYQIRKFKEFKNGKIICFNEYQEKEVAYDFYSKIEGNKHPFSNFWFNCMQNHVTWAVLEKIMDLPKKGTNA